MNRLDFAHRTAKHTLEACDESPDASEDALIFASKVLVDLVPFLDDGTKRRLTPAILKLIHRVPPARRPANLAWTFKSVLDRDDPLRSVVKELDATNRTARREWFERLKRERDATARQRESYLTRHA